MARFLRVSCPCGRALRARPDRAGSTIRCWECGGEVKVPYPSQMGRLWQAYGDAARRSFESGPVASTLLVAAAATGAFAVPGIGPWLGLGVLAGAVGYGYERVVRESGRDLCVRREDLWGDQRDQDEASASALPVDSAEFPMDDADVAPAGEDRLHRGVRILGPVLAGVLAVIALMAPVVARYGGLHLPGVKGVEVFVPRGLVLAALAGWVVVPLLMGVLYAQDRRGRLPAGLTLGAWLRHPLATCAAMLALPVGILLVEGVLSLVALDQSLLSLLVADMSPPPIARGTTTGTHLIYNFDGKIIERNLSVGPNALVGVYPLAALHGYTLTGMLPLSLSEGTRLQMDPRAFSVWPVGYLIFRGVLTFIALSMLGLVAGVQARWLAVTAAIGARRRIPSETRADIREAAPEPWRAAAELESSQEMPWGVPELPPMPRFRRFEETETTASPSVPATAEELVGASI